MRVLVCGGRNYNDVDKVWEVLLDIHKENKIDCIIHGAATGADVQGMIWAQMMNIKHHPFEAQWKDFSSPCLKKKNSMGEEYNALAGFKRNQRMINEGKPDLVVAFPGGKGTQDMVNRAKMAGIPVKDIKVE